MEKSQVLSLLYHLSFTVSLSTHSPPSLLINVQFPEKKDFPITFIFRFVFVYQNLSEAWLDSNSISTH